MTIKITSASFSACITSKNELPKDSMPVVALVGRSNVGKSSLINSLTGRKELARTSSMPGKTLTINFYCINDAFYLVDLPGYGYAKASKATKARIQEMMNEFFSECSNLMGVVQVLDIRHRPSSLDLQMHDWILEQHFNGFAVLTKTDKLSNQQVIKMRTAILKDIRGVYSVNYSAKSLTGRDEFLDAVQKIISGYVFKRTDSERGGRSTPKTTEPRKPAAIAKDKPAKRDYKQNPRDDKAFEKVAKPNEKRNEKPNEKHNERPHAKPYRRRTNKPVNKGASDA